ncbi:MAG TPA: hypothetical protein VH722_21540 [Alphaproteobacteria bacterium]|nr:hypothetical protein [Alphaproteobacteria bacterium]
MSGLLDLFEIPRPLIEPALHACRFFNTSLDSLFYDVPSLVRTLKSRGVTVGTAAADSGRAGELDLSALTDPEGSLLIVDPRNSPYIRAFHDVDLFLQSDEPGVQEITIATITGVGSSALGSAALAWNIAEALGAPALAIVPGYGVADVISQALGGWYGFGLHDFLNVKANLQAALGSIAPKTARIGRALSASAPGSRQLPNGAPVFRTGCGSSDVLHSVMEQRKLRWVVGHSKGALAIHNALGSLDADRVKGLQVVTLGCPVAEDVEGVTYHQYLGLFDALGQLNAWGHLPETWVPTDHSTNPTLPMSMPVEILTRSALSAI